MSKNKRKNTIVHLSSAIWSSVSDLLGKSGLIEIDIISKWDSILGNNIASEVVPLKIEFPKGKKTEGTLKVAITSSGKAIEFSYQKEMVIEKINSYLGYNAIKKIMIIKN